MGRCNAIITPPCRIQLENAIFTAAINIMVQERRIKSTFIVCHAQPWCREEIWSMGKGEGRIRGLGNAFSLVVILILVILKF